MFLNGNFKEMTVYPELIVFQKEHNEALLIDPSDDASSRLNSHVSFMLFLKF